MVFTIGSMNAPERIRSGMLQSCYWSAVETGRLFAQTPTRRYNVLTNGEKRVAAPFKSSAAEDPNAMRVLVVDDDRPSLKMTAFLLREEGYTVFTADNGTEAFRIIDEKAPGWWSQGK